MNIEKIAKKVRHQFDCHRVNVKIIPFAIDKKNHKYILGVDPKPGTKVKSIYTCVSDIKASLHWDILTIFVENNHLFLLTAPQADNMYNSLIRILRSQLFKNAKMNIPIALGYDMIGRPFLAELTHMPHILYGGATNSGKTVALQVLLLSIICKSTAEKVNIVIFDVGSNDLDDFEGIQHLSHPIVKDEATAVYVTSELVKEMERRIKLPKEELCMLPAIVLVIDEAVSLWQNIQPKEAAQRFSTDMANLLRRGRHAKIHIVIGTQDPTKANLNTALSNITARAAFRCHSNQDSRTILGQSGAEYLEGRGSMLYTSTDCPTPKRIYGSYVSHDEVKQLVSYVKNSSHDLSNKFIIPEYDPAEAAADHVQSLLGEMVVDDTANKELAGIIMWVLSLKKVSASKLKEHYEMGNRADDIMDKLFDMGIISEKNAKQPRNVLPTSIDNLSPEVLKLLSKYGYTEDNITAIIAKRTACYAENKEVHHEYSEQ